MADRRDDIERLYRRYARGVASYALARVGDAHAAESIAARVFEKVVARWEQCRANPPAWLWTIVRNEVAQHFRKARAHEPLADSIPAAGPAVVAELANREMCERVAAAMTRMPDEQHRLLYMKFFQDMPNVEIARATGLTPGNVGVLVHRSLKRLRELMEGTAHEPDTRT